MVGREAYSLYVERPTRAPTKQMGLFQQACGAVAPSITALYSPGARRLRPLSNFPCPICSVRSALSDLVVLDLTRVLAAPIAPSTRRSGRGWSRSSGRARATTCEKITCSSSRAAPTVHLLHPHQRGKEKRRGGPRHPQGRGVVADLSACRRLRRELRPGVVEKLGLGYPAVSAVKSNIVYCSISASDRRGRGASARPSPHHHAARG